MKKIIFVSNEFGIGGVEASCLALIRNLDRKKYCIEIHLMCKPQKLLMEIPEDITVKFVEHEIDRYVKPYMVNFRPFLRNKQWIKAMIGILYSIIRKTGINLEYANREKMFRNVPVVKCDVCIVLKENNEGLYYALSRIRAFKLICFFHTEHYVVKAYKKLYESKPDTIFTVSEGNKKFLEQKLPKAKSKIKVIHNIVDLEKVRKDALQYPVIKKKKFRILMVSRLSKEKGLELLLDVCNILKKKKCEFECLIVGKFEDANYEKQSLSLYKQLDLQDTCFFLGQMLNPYPYIASADIVVVPSYRESFGITIREAQILGIPVIATATSGSQELIRNGETGIIIKRNTKENLAKEIENCIQRSNKIEHIAKCLKESNFDETQDILNKFYAELE